jgi:hypothetical protein
MLLLALGYFAVVTVWLLRQRERKKAFVTVLVVTLLIAFVVVMTNLELVDGQLRWNPPE